MAQEQSIRRVSKRQWIWLAVKRQWIWLAVGVCLLALLIWVGIDYGLLRREKTLWDWLQLSGTLLIPVVIAVATIRWNQRQKVAEKRVREQALQREFHRDLSQAYNTGKKVRRLLRVQHRRGGITQNASPYSNLVRRGEVKQDTSPYDKLMEELVTTQLRFELLVEEAPIRFPDVDGSNISSQLEIVEKYLGKIVSEYEEGDSRFPRLREFIAKDKEGLGFQTWRASYSLPTHEVSDRVLKILTRDTEAAEKTETKQVEVDVGQPVELFDRRILTVNNFQRPYIAPNNTPRPLAGNEFICANVTITNKGDRPLYFNPLHFKAEDSSGVKRNAQAVPDLPNPISVASIAPGRELTGNIILKAPKGDANVKVVYDTNEPETPTVTMTVKLP